MKHTTSLLLAAATAGATLAAAADPVVVKILMPMADSQKIGASVISAGPSATSYFVSCPSGEPSDECGLGSGMKVLYGPSTMAYEMDQVQVVDSTSYTYSATVNCALTPSANNADCTGVLVEDGTTSTLAEPLTSYSEYILPVTVTAGADKLSGGGNSGSDDSSSTSADKPSATEGTGAGAKSTLATVTSGTAKPTGTGAAGAAGSSSSSTGAGARATQAAVVVVAAVAAVGAVVM